MLERNLNRPKVGIGVFVFKDGKVLLGKRKGSHAAGVYAGPGGHLEYMESIEGCVKREVMEEAGIEVENIRLLCVSNLKTYAPKHYVDIGVIADWKNGIPKVMEPEKCESWEWYALDNFPQPLFATLINYLEALKTGRNYFDS